MYEPDANGYVRACTRDERDRKGERRENEWRREIIRVENTAII
jgi:hypothetical protein